VFFFIVASGAGALGAAGRGGAAFFLKKVWFCQVWLAGDDVCLGAGLIFLRKMSGFVGLGGPGE
jgi:hypothetical protein